MHGERSDTTIIDVRVEQVDAGHPYSISGVTGRSYSAWWRPDRPRPSIDPSRTSRYAKLGEEPDENRCDEDKTNTRYR